MKLTASQLREYHEYGFLVIEHFLDPATLAAAQAALTLHYPSPTEYFEAPERFPRFSESQFSGLVNFPWASFDLNSVVVDKRMIEVAEQILNTEDIRVTKGELWAKYQGAIDYDQKFHRDFGNHTLLVPRTDHQWKELTTFTYLSDVTKGNGASAIIPRNVTDDIPFGVRYLENENDFNEHVVYIEAPAGSLVLYSYDVFHRGVEIDKKEGYRFMILADYARQDAPWINRHAWPHHGGRIEMKEFMEKINVKQRNLFDIPKPGHTYWNAQTLTDMQLRYPKMDLTPYQPKN
jgi:hypothetical protein